MNFALVTETLLVLCRIPTVTCATIIPTEIQSFSSFSTYTVLSKTRATVYQYTYLNRKEEKIHENMSRLRSK